MGILTITHVLAGKIFAFYVALLTGCCLGFLFGIWNVAYSLTALNIFLSEAIILGLVIFNFFFKLQNERVPKLLSLNILFGLLSIIGTILYTVFNQEEDNYFSATIILMLCTCVSISWNIVWFLQLTKFWIK